MEELQLTLLGSLQLVRGDEDITGQIPLKAQALLCYLAVTGRPLARQVLAGMLWGESSDEDARRSLRVNLTKIRPLLELYLITNRQTVAFDRESPYRLDTEAFEHFIMLSNKAEGATERAHLREAVALYKGDFLNGFAVGDTLELDEWILVERERLRQMAIKALDRLVQICMEQEDYAAGIEYAERLLALDSWREEAHRQLMWLLALSGQRSAALHQYEVCCDILARELAVEPTEETETLYQRIREMEEGERRQGKLLPPLPEAIEPELIPFQAPAPVPFFVGRDEELAHFRATIGEAGIDARQVYAITGMAGVGKTSLAIYLAHALRDLFPDGVLWANLATSDPLVVTENWASAYGYDFRMLADMESRTVALRSVLAEKQVLLILDNVTSAARARALLPGRSRCVVLLTTRNVELAQTLNARPLALAELSPANGRQLLTRIVGDARVAAEPWAAEEICQLLHNLPLAIAIAAQRLASRPRRKLSDFTRRLRDETNRLQLLAVSDQAVRASFAISWEALDEVHRRIFALLAVLGGRAFTADALAAIAEIERYGALDRLDTLVSLSLLNEEGEQHYRQHPLLTDFAREQLGEESAPWQRMVRYYFHYAAQYQHNYEGLRPEWDNLVAGIRIAHQMRLWQMVLDYTTVLREAWFARGRYGEARQAYQWAREAATSLGDDAALCECLLHWGCACVEQNAYDEAVELLSASLERYQDNDYHAGTAMAQYHLARVALAQSHFDKASRLLAESRRLREEVGDASAVADSIYQQARLAYAQGHYEQAELLARQALAMQTKAQDRLGRVRTLRLLTDALRRLKTQDSDLIESYGQEALAFCQELQDQGETAMVLLALSGVYLDRAKLEPARDYAEQSLKLLKTLGDRRSQAQALFQLARVDYQEEMYETAVASVQASLDLCGQLHDEAGMAFVLQLLGDIYAALDRREEAHEVWDRALQIASELDHHKLIQSLNQRLKPGLARL